MSKNGDNGRKDKTWGSRALTWSKAFSTLLLALPTIPLLVTSIIQSCEAMSEAKDAQKEVHNVLKQLNERVEDHENVLNDQTKGLQKLDRRVVFFQAHQAGVEAGHLLSTVKKQDEEIERLHERLNELHKRPRHRPRPKPRVKVLPGPRVENRAIKPTPPMAAAAADAGVPPAPAPKPEPVTERDTPIQQIPTFKPKPFKPLKRGKAD